MITHSFYKNLTHVKSEPVNWIMIFILKTYLEKLICESKPPK